LFFLGRAGKEKCRGLFRSWQVGPDERPVVEVGLAINKSWTDAQGQQQKRTTFVDLAVDLLMLRLQLAKLRSAKGFARLEEELRDFAARLEAKANVPLVGRQLELLQDLQADGWWSSVTLARLEVVRRRLRELAGFVEPRRPSIVVTDFEDEMGLSFDREGARRTRRSLVLRACPARVNWSWGAA
jgi:type I site-specific restriction endonuclease